MANHVILPEIISGYELTQYNNEGYWSLISPEATTNLIINPSFERDDYGWMLPPIPNLELKYERNADISIFGAYSVRIIGKNVVLPERSFIYTPLTEWQYNAPLTLSAYGITFMEATNGKALRVSIALKIGNVVVSEAISQPLKGGGKWYRVHASIQIPDTFRSEDPDKSIELRLYHGGGKDDVVYWDAIQAEAKAYPTTYCDGDMLGLTGDIKPYCWLGAPHRSVSSRSATTRSGGYPINFSEEGFRMLEFQGVGMPPVEVQTQAYGMLPGAIYNQSNYQQREMVLSGQVCGDKFQSLRQQIYAVEKLLSPNVATRMGQFKVLFAQSDCCDDTLEIYAAYNGGMEGDYTSLYQSEFTVRALAADPFFKTIGERGQLLEYSRLVFINNIVQRYGNGEWDNLNGGVRNSGGVSGIEQVRKVLWINGNIVAFGNFDTANGITLNKLAQYSNESQTWIDIFDSVTYIDMTDLDVRDMVALPNGKLVFTAYDTGLTGTGVWTTNLTSLSDCQQTVTQLGSHWLTDPPKTWETLAVALNGDIYAAGSRGNIEYWDGAAWRVFLTGFVGTIHDMQFDVDGYLYAVGDFSYEYADLYPDTYPLKVIPTWKALKTYEVSAVPSQVVLNEGTLICVADVTGDDADDPITTYGWQLIENGSGTPNPTDSRVCKFTLINGDTLFSTIELTITTTSGKVLTNTITYYCDATGDATWTAVGKLATDNKLSYNLDAITFTPDEVTVQADDPITQYLWTNDQTLETSTDKEHTFDFYTLVVGDEVVVTLLVNTAYGGSNTNSITLIKDVDKGMILVDGSATDTETFYSKVIPGQTTTIVCFNGVMIDQNRNVQCLGDLPPSYCLDIGDDKRVYIGARDGLYSWNGESIQKLASTQKITALKINPITGEIYLGGQFGLLKWNFYYLVSAGITLRSEAVINDFDFNECDAALAIGMRYRGAGRTNGYTPLYYPGSAETRPSFRFFGPGELIEITNYTTYQSLYPSHTMQDGEIVDFSLEHGRVGLRSNYWGELPLAKGTNTNFFLAKGHNDFGMWIDNGAPSCTEAVAIFPVKHLSVNALCVPDADIRFPVINEVEPCCDDGRTLVVGDSPLASCYKEPCARGSIIIDPMTRRVWINTQCNEIIDPCDECLPPQRRYIDDAPTPDVIYDCVPGTVVIDPITRGVYVLVGCGADTLLDDNGDPIDDDDGECINDDGGA